MPAELLDQLQKLIIKETKFQVIYNVPFTFENFFRYGKVQEISQYIDHDKEQSNDIVDDPMHPRAKRDPSKPKLICFICQEIRTVDSNRYEDGGLARCSHIKSRDRIVERVGVFLSMPDHKFNAAANRLKILESGQSLDIFSIDVYYHQSCYVKFALKPVTKEEESAVEALQKREEIMTDFFRAVRIKILRKKEAFLLHVMLADIKSFSEEYNLPPIMEHTVELKRKLIAEFGDEISFFPSGKYLIVHASSINPCQYSVAILQGRCLRDDDLVKSFSSFIRLKAKCIAMSIQEENNESPQHLIDMLDRGPMQELYNVIYASIYTSEYQLNESAYAVTSSNNMATKIWSLASDWESLITKENLTKQLILGQTVHRITASKETIKNLHRLGHTASYNDILKLNKQWSKMVSSTPSSFAKGFLRGIPVHSSIDNNDGRQETFTGAGTTHDTNRTLFQPIMSG